jgi:hypothetical protein
VVVRNSVSALAAAAPLQGNLDQRLGRLNVVKCHTGKPDMGATGKWGELLVKPWDYSGDFVESRELSHG